MEGELFFQLKGNAPWPSYGDSLFEGDNLGQTNAMLGYGLDTLDLYAEGYKRGADQLVENALAGRGTLDFVVYPVVYLYRHYLELKLKVIIRDGLVLLDQPPSFPKHHNLLILWLQTRRLMQKIFDEEDRVATDAVEKCIRELDKVDPDAQKFRYPVDRNGVPTGPAVKTIGFVNLRKVMERIDAYLDAAVAAIDYDLEMRCEFRMEFGP